MNWSSVPNLSYVVQCKPGLDASAWTSIATNRSIGTLTCFTDTDTARLNQPQGYYRIIRLP
jgi:hypothetical protein